ALEPHLRRETGGYGLPKNVITRSLGPNPQVEVDMEGPYPIEDGDVFLLCSDGLTGKVTDQELGEILKAAEPETAARLLVDLANLRGGPDNITAVVARFQAPEWLEPARRMRWPLWRMRRDRIVVLLVLAAVGMTAAALLWLADMATLAVLTLVA